MLARENRNDRGALAFMNALMGLGVFVIDTGTNAIAVSARTTVCTTFVAHIACVAPVGTHCAQSTQSTQSTSYHAVLSLLTAAGTHAN